MLCLASFASYASHLCNENMATLIAIPIFSFLLILQSAVLSQVPLVYGTADLALLAMTAWALQKRVDTAWHWGVVGGLMTSFVSALPTGAPLLGYLLTIGLTNRDVAVVSILRQAVSSFTFQPSH